MSGESDAGADISGGNSSADGILLPRTSLVANQPVGMFRCTLPAVEISKNPDLTRGEPKPMKQKFLK